MGTDLSYVKNKEGDAWAPSSCSARCFDSNGVTIPSQRKYDKHCDRVPTPIIFVNIISLVATMSVLNMSVNNSNHR